MFMPEKKTEVSESQLRVAFDGDAVLFSDESERIFKAHGLDKFFEHERENEDTLLDHVCIIQHFYSLPLQEIPHARFGLLLFLKQGQTFHKLRKVISFVTFHCLFSSSPHHMEMITQLVFH